jgi:hypothetical protein
MVMGVLVSESMNIQIFSMHLRAAKNAECKLHDAEILRQDALTLRQFATKCGKYCVDLFLRDA